MNNSSQPRIQAGQGTASGRFTFDIKEQQAVDIDDSPPLRDFKIVGYERKAYTPPGSSTSQPSGICYHCGAAIMNCVVIENPKTGDVVDVGETCAERVGLDMSALRAMLRERRQDEQRTLNRAEREATERARDEKEAADTASFGEHGTESRWQSGCRCDQCSGQAPHGQVDRLVYGRCLCQECVDAAIASGQYEISTKLKLVDLETHKILPARCVRTKFGLSWVVNNTDDSASWYPYSPTRRNTITKRGATEVEVECLVRRYRYDGETHYQEVAVLSHSGVDKWQEPIQIEISNSTSVDDETID